MVLVNHGSGSVRAMSSPPKASASRSLAANWLAPAAFWRSAWVLLIVGNLLWAGNIIVGRVIDKSEETMRTTFEIHDNTGAFKVIFYQKGENEVPQALQNFNSK